MKNLIHLFVTSALTLGAAVVMGQESGNLNVQTIVQKEEIVVDIDGLQRTQLVAATEVVPGDEVVYTITFHNISDEAAENVVVTNPIAAELTYIDRSAFGPGARIEFSVDGGRSYAVAEQLVVLEDDEETRPARPEDFTHIRWSMAADLVAGAQGVARFRARLN